jgi:amino acid adenylation domain-containing protein
VLKAGGAYVPIDPAYPPDRVAFILEDTAAPVLLTQQLLLPVLPPHSARVICLDGQQKEIERASGEPLTTTVSPDNLAYIIYTSGSTGKPKGVMVTHRNICRLFAATQDSFAFNKNDVWTLFHSYAFDFSVWEMWGALLHGGRLVIVPYWVSRSPDAFYELLVREGVTVLNQTPSAFRQLCQVDEKSEREVQQSLALRLVIFGGEALDFESLEQWFRDHGDKQPQLVNMYGITETTVHVTERYVRAADIGADAGEEELDLESLQQWFRDHGDEQQLVNMSGFTETTLHIDDRNVHSADLAANTGSLIGHPISDLRGYVLDRHMELLPTGVPGELYVGGAGVARGYLWRPELSAERFVPDPFTRAGGERLYRTGDLVRYRAEGELEYLGRVDQQVKIRGFRIEPGEIEWALERHEAVREAVVIASEDVPGEPRLIAYIVAKQNFAPNDGERNETMGSAELSAEQVAQWEMVFNENYQQPSSQPDPTFNIAGWNNSYTGTPIAEEEMREWLDQTIERIMSLQPQNVLEIGCGTGLLLFRLAPHCTRYVATDFSPIALDYIQQTLSLRNEDLPQLELHQRGADNLEGIEPNSLDLVILNSVVQYFPSIDYLLRVIEGAVKVLKPGGSIFIGDVRSLPLLEAFHVAVQLQQAPASLPVAQLEQRVKRHMAQEEELIIEPAFFAALRQQFPQIGDVQALLKRGRYQNEMTQFRYDVILRLDVRQTAAETRALDWQDEKFTLTTLPQFLRETQPEVLTLTNVPNARVFTALKAMELLAGSERPETVAGLREALKQIGPGNSVDPEAVAILADGMSYDVLPGWSTTNSHSSFDIVCQRRASDNHRITVSTADTNGHLRPWSTYANKPLEGRFARSLVPKLRSFLQEQLPDYMVPSAFVLLDAMPLTPHGKINRRALPAPDQARPELDDIYVAPHTPVEKELAAMFAHVLGVNQIGLHDNFFDLGGHSLLATQLLSRMLETFSDKKISLRHIFESPTVAGLALEIEATGTVAQKLPPLLPIPRDKDLPLSFAQQRLWFLDRLEPGKATYNCPAAVRFTGALNIAALEQSLNEVVRRHEALRTRFSALDGSPVQIIAPTLEVPLPIVDLSRLPGAGVEIAIEQLSRLEAQRAFNLSHDALLRAKVLRVSANEHVVLLTMHHIVSDGWSIGVLVKEVAILYEAYAKGSPSSLAPLAVQYADYAHWEREWLQGEVLDEQLDYWKQQLANAPVLELPADRPRPPVPTYGGAYESFELDQELTAALNELSRRLDATLFMTLMAAWQVLLHRYSGQSDIVVGTPIANRRQAETEDLIGFFVNMLAIRTDLSGNPTFRELVVRVRETALGAYAHQSLPFEKLIEELQPERDASHTPLVQVVLALQNAPQADLTTLDLKLSYMAVDTSTAKFDIVINVYEIDDELLVVFTYSTDLFDASTMQRLGHHFKAMLAAVVEGADKRVSELEFLSPADLHRLIVEANATEAIYPVEKCVHELFEEQVRRDPEAIALVANGTELTYAELQRRADLLAAHLQQGGIGPGSSVGIFLDHSIETVVAILSVLRAGAAYVPMDTDHPRLRLAFIIEDAQLSTILTQGTLIQRLPLNDRIKPILLDEKYWQETRISADVHRATPADAAYVIYTSGSTGQPKGVKISHQALVNYLCWCRDVYVRNEEVSFALYSSLAFDLTVTSLFTPLLTGNRLIIYEHSDRFAVPGIMRDNLVDVLKLTPSHLALIKDLDNRHSRVKRLIVGGESLTTDLAAQVHESFGGRVEILNEYGPTETTVGCMLYRYDPQRDRRSAVPIGRPAANVQIYVLDEHLNPTPENVIGELHISGAGLADGYVNRPDLTAEKFIANPFVPGTRMYRSGDRARWLSSEEIEYLGRRDEQVKYHGYRVELDEIRSALNRHSQVRDSVVMLRPNHRGEDILVAYYVARREIENGVLREFLLDHLIKETIPNVFIHLTRLPLTLNGKVDYRALPELKELKQRKGEYVAPRTAVEEVVADIWANLLGLHRVSLYDNFFELGGHSLIATQVMVRAQKTMGVDLPLRALFESPTVAKFAAQIEAALRFGTGFSFPPLMRVERDKDLPLSFAQQRLWFLQQLESGSAVYNLPAAVRFRGALNIAVLEQSFNEVARRHEALRTSFVSGDGYPLQVIASSSRVPLPVIDLSRLPPERLEKELQRLSMLEAQRSFDLSHGPLLRTKLLRVSEDEHVALVTMHHIISDGWSIGVLVKEVAALYTAYADGLPSALESLPVQYADYAHWEREWLQGEVLDKQLEYWLKQFAVMPRELDLPADFERPAVRTYRGASQPVKVSQHVTAMLKELSRREAVTLFMTLLAGFKLLLHRYTAQDDIVVGSPIANRNHVETENLIGCFINTLALRTNLGGNPTFRELLGRVREVTFDAYAHQDLAFELLVSRLQPKRKANTTPLFQVWFTLDNTPTAQFNLPGLQISQVYSGSEVSQFDLTLTMSETSDGLAGLLNYNSDLFEAETVAQMIKHFLKLLEEVAMCPDLQLFDVRLHEEETAAPVQAVVNEDEFVL